MLSHLLIADTHSDDGPDWRLSDEFFPGSAEGSLAELPSSVQALPRGGSSAPEWLPSGLHVVRKERLIFVARLERDSTHCVPAAEHCAGTMLSDSSGDRWGDEVDNGMLLDPREPHD